MNNPEVSAADRREERLLFVLASLVGSAVLVSLYNPWRLPILGDNQTFFYVSERVAAGVPPHQSFFNARHSLMELLAGGLMLIGRPFGLPDLAAGRVLSVAVFATGLGLVAVLVRRLGSSRVATTMAVLAVLSFPSYLQHVSMGFRPKVLLVFFILLATLFLLRRRPLGAGLATGCCFLIWQPALIVWAAAGIAVLCWRRDRGDSRRYLLGSGLPVLAYEAYFFAHGVLLDQLQQTYLFPARFMSGDFGDPLGTLRRLSRFWDEAFGLSNPAGPFLLLILAWFWLAVARDPRGSMRRLADRPEAVFLLLACHGWIAFTRYDQQGSPDLFPLIPFLALATAGAVTLIERILETGASRRLRPVAMVVLAATFVLTAMVGRRELQPRFSLADQKELASRVASLSVNHEIYAIGCLHLLAFNRMQNWSRFSFFYRGVAAYLRVAPGGLDLPTRGGRLPTLVLTSRRLPPEIKGALADRYHNRTRAGFRRQFISVWTLPPGLYRTQRTILGSEQTK